MKDLFSLKDKVVAITGGTGVLGGSFAEYLTAQEAQVLVLGRNEQKISQRVEQLNSLSEYPVAYGYLVDILDETNLKEVLAQIQEKWPQIDGLINAAGGNLPGATVGEGQSVFDVASKDLREVLDLNLMGTVLPSLAFGKVMAKQGFGSIINISSMAAQQTLTRVLGYSMAKAAVDIFTKWMATECSQKLSDKIRVNALAPGFFIGNQNRSLLTHQDGSYTQRGQTIIQNTPMGRFGEASELNGAMHYLLSEASCFVTGTVMAVDGGFSAFSGV